MDADGRQRIIDLFDAGALYCAELVLTFIAEAGGVDPARLTPMATGFCGGLSRTCGQCGAVSGAVMGIGLFAGRSEPGGEYDPCYALTQEFLERFRAESGSINCLEITGCDFSVDADRKRFSAQGLRARCEELAALAVDIALDLLRGNGSLPEAGELAASRIAPCGLCCGTCLAYDGGPVQQAASALRAALGDNFAPYAERFAAMNPVFGDYAPFSELLDYLASGSCSGCRGAGCLFTACRVGSCSREHGVDYCFQCAEFPCDRHGMPGPLAERWLVNNERMRDIGPEAWFAAARTKPRYP
jgi:C_GCAxxG_C_C family probable redox protein